MDSLQELQCLVEKVVGDCERRRALRDLDAKGQRKFWTLLSHVTGRRAGFIVDGVIAQELPEQNRSQSHASTSKVKSKKQAKPIARHRHGTPGVVRFLLEGEVLYETEKAFGVGRSDGRLLWIAKSQLTMPGSLRKGQCCEYMDLPEWFGDKLCLERA